MGHVCEPAQKGKQGQNSDLQSHESAESAHGSEFVFDVAVEVGEGKGRNQPVNTVNVHQGATQYLPYYNPLDLRSTYSNDFAKGKEKDDLERLY